jgi:hypothetical protein
MCIASHLRYALVSIIVAGCSACSMVSSYPVEDSSTLEPSGQAGGSYFLAKHILQVVVEATGAKPRLIVAAVPVQDRSALIQTGFNLSPTSDDDVKIEYEKGLLKKVTAKADDKTDDILIAIAGLAGRYRETQVGEIAGPTFDFDPFDFDQAAETNAILLTKYRSCVEVEIEPGLWSPGCGNFSLSKRSIGGVGQARFTHRISQGGELAGIYYRRPVAHRVHVVEAGKTLQLVHMNFANHAPVFRVDIDRTLFVNRETTVDFTDGALTAVQVKKPSEGLALASLPLSIIQAFVSVPVEGVSKHKQVQQSEASLNHTRSAVLQATAGEQDATANGFASDRRSGRGDGRSGVLSVSELQDCRNIGIADPDLCADLLRRNGR